MTAQQGAGIHSLRLADQPLGDLARIERGVGLADRSDERVAALEAALERRAARPLSLAAKSAGGLRGRTRARRQAWWR